MGFRVQTLVYFISHRMFLSCQVSLILLLMAPFILRMIAVVIGEAFGHWFNDWMANRYIARHHGCKHALSVAFRFSV
jgi:hypothetical protein